MYNIFDFLLVQTRNKMYEGAAQANFILVGTNKKSEVLCSIWLNVGVELHFLTVAVKCITWDYKVWLHN